jgi:hypothetical protein
MICMSVSFQVIQIDEKIHEKTGLIKKLIRVAAFNYFSLKLKRYHPKVLADFAAALSNASFGSFD